MRKILNESLKRNVPVSEKECVVVAVRERRRGKNRERESEKESQKRERKCVWVCVCVREIEREVWSIIMKPKCAEAESRAGIKLVPNKILRQNQRK